MRLLALVHVSSRYDVRDVLAEAREEFPATEAPRDFDLVEIPFPERGEPAADRERGPGAGRPAQRASPSGAARSAIAWATADRLVLLEEVLGGQEDRVVDAERLLGELAAGRARAPGRARPRRSAPGRGARRARPRGSRCFSSVSSKPRMILQEGAAAVAALQQLVVGVDLVPRGPPPGRRFPGGRRARRRRRGEGDSAQIGPIPGMENGRHRPWAAERGHAEQRVERRQRKHAVRVAHRPLAADRPADVVDHQVAALDSERVDRLAGPPREARPRVVEARLGARPGRGPGSRRRSPAALGRRGPGSPSGRGTSSWERRAAGRRACRLPARERSSERPRPESAGPRPGGPRSPRVSRPVAACPDVF